MKSRNQKLLFNSIAFFIAGIISVLRSESVEIIISFAFSILFLALNFIIKEKNNETVFQQFEI